MSILEKIYEASLRFLARNSPDEVYSAIVSEAIKLVGAYSGGIYLRKDNFFGIVYASKSYMYKIVPRKNANTYKAFSQTKTIVADISDIGRAHPEVKRERIKSSIFIPLSYEKKAIGVLTLDSRKTKGFNAESKRILLLFGSFASLAIKKAQLNNEIIKSLEDRDLFISLASHELRTPLTTINGYIQLLLAKVRERRPIDNKWILELSFETERMKNLLDEFLEINRIRLGKMQFNFSEISLSEIINYSISTFKFNYPKRKLLIKNKLPEKDLVIGDSDKLHQVFINVLENAAKYSNPKTEISVEMSRQKDYFKIIFTDKGQGIAIKDIPLVFKGFYKGVNSKHEGMGLGLYLAKNIIDAHHGEILIKSRLNFGTKVVVKLPESEEK